MYKEDWLGLRELDAKGGLVFEILKGRHMEIGEEELRRVMEVYFGPEMGGKGTKVGDEVTKVAIGGAETPIAKMNANNGQMKQVVIERIDPHWIDL